MALPGLYDCFQHWGQKSGAWIISDTHFGDFDIKKGFPNRPSDDELVKLINQKVGKTGLLLHLGDVGDLECARQLKGYKVLVCGNHDAGATNYKRQVITQTFNKDNYTRDEVMALLKERYPNWKISITEGYNVFHSPFEYWYAEVNNCLFDEVYTGPLMIGEKILLSHEPISVPWAMNLHGHNHQGKKKNENNLNVCADVINYTPLNFNQLLKNGLASKAVSIHRQTIDVATERKQKRGNKKIGKK